MDCVLCCSGIALDITMFNLNWAQAHMSLDKSHTLTSLKVSTTLPIHSPTGPSNEASIHSSHKCKMTSNEKPVLGEPSEDCMSVLEAEPIGLQAYKV